jgi:hypothetical protein
MLVNARPPMIDADRQPAVVVEDCASVDPDWWNGLAGSVAEGDVHQTTYWADYMRRYYGARPYFLVAHRGGKVAAILLMFRMGRYPDQDARRPWRDALKRPLNALMPVLRWYDGPVVLDADPAVRGAIVAALLERVREVARRERIAWLAHGSLPPGWPVEAARAVAGDLDVTEWGTIIVDLTAPPHVLFGRLKPSAARSTVQRAIKLGLAVREVTDEPIDAHARCEYEHSVAHGIPAWPAAAYAAMQAALAPAGVYRVLAAEHEGRAVAYTPVMLFNRRMHLVKPVQSPRCQRERLPAGDLLLWEAIRLGHERGLTDFDLAGVAPSPSTDAERGIRFFKSKWGGRYLACPIVRGRMARG